MAIDLPRPRSVGELASDEHAVSVRATIVEALAGRLRPETAHERSRLRFEPAASAQ
jgi:hypothetical protein